MHFRAYLHDISPQNMGGIRYVVPNQIIGGHVPRLPPGSGRACLHAHARACAIWIGAAHV